MATGPSDPNYYQNYQDALNQLANSPLSSAFPGVRSLIPQAQAAAQAQQQAGSLPNLGQAASGTFGQLTGAQGQQQQNWNQQAAAIGGQQQGIAQQQAFAQALMQQMQGGGPNLAQTQLQAATDRANQQAAGLVGAQKGINPGIAARQILEQQAQNTQAAANQSAQLRQQQQLAAQGQLGGALQGIQGGLQGITEANIAGGQQGLQQQQLLGQLGLGQAGITAGLGQQVIQNTMAQNQANQQAAQTGLGVLGGIGGALTGIAGALYEGGPVHDMRGGGAVPGEAQHPGDHPDNDTVPAMLSPGEIVLPRSVTGADDGSPRIDPKKAAEFMKALNKYSPKDQPKGSYGRVLQAKKKLQMYAGGRVR